MKTRSIVFCLIAGITLSFCNNQKRLLRIAKKEMDPKNWVKPVALHLDFNAESDMKIYSDSLNNLTDEAALPAFIFDECFDYKPMLWPDMHHAISLRQMVVKKVTNRLAIQRILQDDNPLLHKVCDAEGEIEVPDGDKSFYELFRLRYAELQEDEEIGKE